MNVLIAKLRAWIAADNQQSPAVCDPTLQRFGLFILDSLPVQQWPDDDQRSAFRRALPRDLDRCAEIVGARARSYRACPLFRANDRLDAILCETFEALRDRWIPLTVAMNSLSRSMGHPDFYPFVISSPALVKLAFVHSVIRTRQD